MSIAVANFDVAGICGRVVRYANEFLKSQSKSQVEFTVHDRERATSYLDELVRFLTLIKEPVDPLDLPKTHPSSYPIVIFPEDSEIDLVENETLKDLVRRFKAMYLELYQSQSKDRASGILPADLKRMESLIANCRGIIEFGTQHPDLPENPGDVAAGATTKK